MFKYITLTTGAEVICFLVSIICLLKSNSLIWRCFIPYLLITCITEFIGIYLKRNHHTNQWPYNILLIFQILVVSVMFMQLFNNFIKSKVIVTCGLILLIVLYMYDIVIHGFLLFNELTYNAMCVLFVLYCLYYFYLLLNSEQYIELKYSPEFWWICGALFFYFGSTAVNLFRDLLTPIIVNGLNITHYIYIILNTILYGFWSYSFICKKWLTQTSKA